MAERFNVSVSAAIFDRRGRLLLLRRGPHKRFLPGVWEMPGGRVERGESLEAAARREVLEEAGIRAKVGRPLHFYEYRMRGRRHVNVCFLARGRGVPRAADGMASSRWVSRAELSKIRMSPRERAAALAAFSSRPSRA